jgi:uncharacterized membrane protein YkgB
MVDPELKKDLRKIESELSHMDQASTRTWGNFWRGCVYGAGYVIGATIIIVIIGWILNIIGVIPALADEVAQFRMALEHFK